MHDRLFISSAQLDAPSLQATASTLDLDPTTYAACLAEPASRAAVSRDLAQAKALGLESTPAFLLGSRLNDGRVQVSKAFYGALPIDQFRTEIERAMDPAAPSWVQRVFGLFLPVLEKYASAPASVNP